jgi:cytochrome bd-type quinol oxidase subunit 1
MNVNFLSKFAAACGGPDISCTNDCYCTNLPQSPANAANIQNIVHIVVATLAAIAVLIIVISALNIVTAGGDSDKVRKARNAILFALIGIVVVVAADVIVSFIIGRLV